MTKSTRPLASARRGTQSLERAVEILRDVSTLHAGGATLPSLVHGTGLNRTTVYRMLQCLVRVGAVRVDARSKRYFLGPLMLELGMTVGQQPAWQRLSDPILAHLASQTGDTVSLMFRCGDEEICVGQKSGAFPIKTLVAEVGTRRPLGLGAGSLAVLAAVPDAECREIVARNARLLAAQGRSADEVLRLVQRVRRPMIAFVPVHRIKGVDALAVSITDRHGGVVGSLSITAIAERLKPDRRTTLKPLLSAAARSIGDLL